MNFTTDPWVWFASLGMIAIFSFVFKENPVYRAFEHIYVGAAAGYAISVNVQNIYNRAWVPLTTDGKWVLLIPVALGILLYARFFSNIAWLSRWPMSFMSGIGAGLAIYGAVQSQFIAQIRSTLVPLNSVDNVVLVVGVLSILLYFFFSREQTGPLKHVSGLGRWVMMVTFGVSFGNVVMGRITLMLGILQKLLSNWMGLI
ncbi:MAG: hypothetical protein ACOX18_05275 [Bacillota bacterium]